MTVPHWPPAMRQTPQRGSWTGGPQDTRAKFEPDYGPALMRRRTTARFEKWQGVFPNLNAAMRSAFLNFCHDTLQDGALAFCWRDPVTDEVALWKIEGSGELLYQFAENGAGLRDLNLQLMRLPGTPWWAASVRAVSSVPPETVLDFQAGRYGRPPLRQTFADLVTLTRASTGTFVNAAGVIQTAAVNVARFDANGLIIEPAVTNLALWSEDLTNGAWTKTRTTVTANAIAAPDAAVTADKLIETAVAGTHFANQAFAGRPTNTPHTFTAYVKAAERTRGTIRMDAGADQVIGDFDLVAGTINGSVGGLGVLGAVSIEALASGWFRVRVSGIPNPTTTSYTCQVNLRDGSGNANYTGDGTSGLFVWGAQFAQNAAPTSYIPTAAATVTRSADVVTLASAITGEDVRITDRAGVVTTLLNATLSAGTWPVAAANGARSIAGFPVGSA
jgi:hypothetical protein